MREILTSNEIVVSTIVRGRIHLNFIGSLQSCASTTSHFIQASFAEARMVDAGACGQPEQNNEQMH